MFWKLIKKDTYYKPCTHSIVWIHRHRITGKFRGRAIKFELDPVTREIISREKVTEVSPKVEVITVDFLTMGLVFSSEE